MLRTDPVERLRAHDDHHRGGDLAIGTFEVALNVRRKGAERGKKNAVLFVTFDREGMPKRFGSNLLVLGHKKKFCCHKTKNSLPKAEERLHVEPSGLSRDWPR